MSRFLAVFFIVAAIGAPVRAQRAITFNEAMRLALSENPDLLQAELSDEASELNVSSARVDALPLPFVSASISPTQRYGLSFDQTTGQLNSQTSESLNLSVGGSVNLFNGFRGRRALEQARLLRSASTFSFEYARQQVAFEVASRFLQVMLDKEFVGIRQQTLTAQGAQLDQIEALVEAGVRAQADLFSQRAAVAQARAAVLQAEQAVGLSETRLVEYLVLDPFGEYEFVAPALSNESLVAEDLSLDILLRTAYERRADLRAQERNIEAARAGIAVARSGRLPSIDLSAGYGTGYSSLQQRLLNPDTSPVSFPVTTEDGRPVLLDGVPFLIPISTNPEFENTPIFSQFADNRAGNISLSISIPIFDRYQTSRQVQQARLEVRQQEVALERVKQAIAVAVRQAVNDYRNAAEQLDAASAQVEAAEAALRAERDRYELGTGTLVAQTQAQTAYAEALASRLQAIYQFVFSRKLIEFAQGNFDPNTALLD